MKCKKCDGTIHNGECKLCEMFAAAQPAGGAAPSIWQDFTSLALKVHPKQVEQANARLKRHSIVGAYDKQGVPHIPDRGNHRKLLRLEGFHDNHAGYGD